MDCIRKAPWRKEKAKHKSAVPSVLQSPATRSQSHARADGSSALSATVGDFPPRRAGPRGPPQTSSKAAPSSCKCELSSHPDTNT